MRWTVKTALWSAVKWPAVLDESTGSSRNHVAYDDALCEELGNLLDRELRYLLCCNLSASCERGSGTEGLLL